MISCAINYLFLALVRLGFFFLALGAFLLGQAEEGCDRLADARSLVLLFELRLALDGEARERDRFEPRVRDWFARHLANAVGAELDPLQRLVDFIKRVLFLRKQAEREIAIVSVAAGICLVHAERGSFATLGARAEIVLRHAGHGIHHRVAQLEELVLLSAHERVELAFLVILGRENFVLRVIGTEMFPGPVRLEGFCRPSCYLLRRLGRTPLRCAGGFLRRLRRPGLRPGFRARGFLRRAFRFRRLSRTLFLRGTGHNLEDALVSWTRAEAY